MFRTVRLSIIRSLFTLHSAKVYVIRVCRQLSSRSICSCSKALYKPVWHIPLLSVKWINSWWWTDELSETCRVSCQNKFVKLVHLFGFIIKKAVTMNDHMNVKLPRLPGRNLVAVAVLSHIMSSITCAHFWRYCTRPYFTCRLYDCSIVLASVFSAAPASLFDDR